MTLNCVRHIQERGLESLTHDFGIVIKDYGDFVLLNYDQIESPKFNSVVDECRGLILAKDSWKVLCRSFDRFYNYGEDPRSEEFPINQSTVTEKVDGSLIRFWFNPYKDKWCAATRKMAFAEGPVTNGSRTFLDVIQRETGSVNGYFSNDNELRGNTIICELVSPETRVVKPYGETAIYYLGMRDNETGKYITVPDETDDGRYNFDWYFTGFKRPKVYTFGTLADCVEAARNLTDLDEGYVADYDGWRMKIKSPAYLAVAHLRNNGAVSESRILHLILSGEDDEYLNYFPEDIEIFRPWKNAFIRMRQYTEVVYNAYKDIEDQKTFALEIKDSPVKGFMFTMRKTGKSVKEIIQDMLARCDKGKAPDSLVELVSKYKR